MRRYTYNRNTKRVLTIVASIFIIASFILVITEINNESWKAIWAIVAIIMFSNGIPAILTMRFLMDDNKIEKSFINIPSLLFKNKQPKKEILHWDEIRQIYTFFIGLESIPHIRLKPKKGINKKTMGFAATSIEQVEDILNHLPEGVDIKLYPELHKELKKRYSA